VSAVCQESGVDRDLITPREPARDCVAEGGYAVSAVGIEHLLRNDSSVDLHDSAVKPAAAIARVERDRLDALHLPLGEQGTTY
jgi:hypothetical protein